MKRLWKIITSLFKKIESIIAIIFISSWLCSVIFFWSEVSKYDDVDASKKVQETAIVLGIEKSSKTLWSKIPINRLDEAVRLYRAGFVKNIILTGKAEGTGSIEEMREYLLDYLPTSKIISAKPSNYTFDHLVEAYTICRNYRYKNAYLITDDYEMARSLSYANEINAERKIEPAPVHSDLTFLSKFGESFTLLVDKIRRKVIVRDDM